ncbi:single-stranded DNA-binding protein [Pseudomonas nitritireducens]|uniref:Single-stranded DNA-binding protein n=1 Tax=Pseudomonas nitroreducens TaxID=46680 RepID=A0A7W7KEP5_PSENT|nr:hypothetical protein [Pseudomonas nitritireducens]MBB4861434.1 single-stranded DNA-binding protein [Pseudomonas nitritireducens]
MTNIVIGVGQVQSHEIKSGSEGQDKLTVNVRFHGRRKPEFLPVVAWGPKGFADKLAPHLTKGQMVQATGRKKDNVNDTDEARYENPYIKLESLHDLVLLNFTPSDAKSGGDIAANGVKDDAPAPTPTPDASPNPQPAPDYDSFDDDIPFDDPYRRLWNMV